MLQVILTIVQHKGRGRKALSYEMIWTLLFLKSPRDVYRVASGTKQEKGMAIDPLLELSITKTIELFTEGLPAIIIQISAAMTKGGTTYMEGLSMIVSILVAGFTATQISFDLDVDPTRRSKMPDFYGYVPDTARDRQIVFIALLLISSLMMAIRSLSAILLSSISLNYVGIYFAADIGFHLLVRVLRDDFIHWIPSRGFIADVFSSLLIKSGLKVVIDITSIMHFRHPSEVGGMHWLFSQVTAVATLFISLNLVQEKGHRNSMINSLWLIGAFLTGALFISFYVFFKHINEGYAKTFYSFETGAQMTVRMFNAHQDDGARAEVIFTNNENY